MLAQTARVPFDHGDWLFELKLDGIRCIAFLDSTTRLQARSGTDITAQFPELHGLHRQVTWPCILDGEIVCANFTQIMRRVHRQKPLDIKVAAKVWPARYHVFDILNVNGKDVEPVNLMARKQVLNTTFIPDERGLLMPWQVNGGVALFQEVVAKGGEGIMAKNMASPYVEGKRSEYWKKIKNFQEGEFYICGVTEGEGARADTFGSLILGERVGDRWVYIGNAGSGLDERELKSLLNKMSGLKAECPFAEANVGKPVKLWAKPIARVEVRYFERGSDGKLRFPTFRKLL